MNRRTVEPSHRPSHPGHPGIRTRRARSLASHAGHAIAFVAATQLLACAVESAGTDAPGDFMATLASNTQPLSSDGSNNILLIIADDVGVDNVSAYEEHADSAYTPNIDGLATSGVLFRNAWVNPMCSPSRASILTGRHAFRHGILHPSSNELASSEETIAEVLSDAGYATALFGKWHLGETSGSSYPTDQGFDYFSGSLEGNVDDYFSWDKTTLDAAAGTETSTTETRYATTVNVMEAKSWIGDQTGPWMVTMAFNSGHSPFHVPPHVLHTGSLGGSVGDTCDGTTDTTSDCYRAMVEAMDTKIGTLLDWLSTQGELDNTLVIVLGDNGTPGQVVIDDGVFSTSHAKSTVYEGGVNVPLIISGPGVESGVEVTDLVQVLDVFATLREVGNGASSSGVTVDSSSLYDYLVGNTVSSARSNVYTELYSESIGIDRWSVTNGTAKYIYNDGVEECYNLVIDPGESTNKYDETGAPVQTVCNALANQRPCLATSECPGS